MTVRPGHPFLRFPLVLALGAALGLLGACESFQEGQFGETTAASDGRSPLTRTTFDWFGRTFGDEPPPAAAPPQPALAAAKPAAAPWPAVPSPIAPPRGAAAAPAPVPSPALRTGSDYDATLGVYRPLALEGQSFAQFEMGRMYENGQGVPRDLETARAWYRRAAAQNDRNAVAALARLDGAASGPAAAADRPALALVAPGAAPPPPVALAPAPPVGPGEPPPLPAARIVPPPAPPPPVLEPIRPPDSYADGIAAFNARDYAAAAQIWEPLAQEGEANSQTRMGYLYEHGLGVVPDSAKAADWYRRAAEQDDPAGAFNLGVLYRKGQGVPRDDLIARQWYERAARNGHPVAPRVLALMNEAGLGLDPDAPKPAPAAPASN